jgi:putative ABC transport system permease protein
MQAPRADHRRVSDRLRPIMIPDLRFALRQLLKSPGFAAIALLTLALGIGVNTTMFTVLNALVLQSSPAPDSGRLVSVSRTTPHSQFWPHSPAQFFDLQKQSASFERLAAYNWGNFNLAAPGQPAERLSGMSVSADFFPTFRIQPLLGRVFTPEDDQAGAGQVAILSEGFWRAHFSADPNILGRTLRLDAQSVTVVGVMPAVFDDPFYWGHIDLWKPQAYDGGTRQIRDNNWLQIVGRLRPGVTLAQARSEAGAIAARLAHDYPATNEKEGLRLDPWNEIRTGNTSRKVSWLCMALAAFVLLIACANLANLQLARMASRGRELAVRVAIGASRLQIVRQLIVENLLLSLVGALLGTALAVWSTRLIGSQVYISGVKGIDFPIDRSVLAFTLLASVATGIAVGTVPAWIATRTDVSAALKQGSRGATGDRSRHRLRQALIVTELVLALVLLSGAGYFVRGMRRLAHADMGWKPDGIVTATLSLPYNASYATDAQCQAFFDKLATELAGLPGVEQSTIAATLPITGFWRSSDFAVEGRPQPEKGKEPLAYDNSVIPGHFAVVGMHLLAGRDFTDADRSSSRAVAIINETMARTLWPGESALGKRFGSFDAAHRDWVEVVGVVNDVHSTVELFRRPDTPFQVYRPLAQTPSGFVHWLTLGVRSNAPAPTVAAALRRAVQRIDADQPVYGIVSVREAMAQVTRSLDLTGQLLGAFALLGLALASVGIYGVIANLVAQRRPEIGIRMALGAQAWDVLWLVLAQGLRLALLGTAIGFACAWGLVRLLDAMIPGIPGGDPTGIALVTVILAAVAILACWLPARRATRVNPIEALRSE